MAQDDDVDFDDEDDNKPSKPGPRKGQGQRGNRPQGGKRPRGPKQSQGAIATGAAAVLGTMAGAQGAIQDGLLKGVTREVAGKAATALPDRYLRPLRGVSQGVVSATVIAAPVVTGVIARALGASPGVRGVVTDLTADFFGTVGERLTGQPHSEKSKESARTGLEGKKEELEKLRGKKFVVIQGNTDGSFHDMSCLSIPHPTDRNAKRFFAALDQIRGQNPELKSVACCGGLIKQHEDRVQKLEKEIGEMETTKKPKTFAELMATVEGQRVELWIHHLLGLTEIETGHVNYTTGQTVVFEGGIYAFLANNLDEDELPMLSAWSVWTTETPVLAKPTKTIVELLSTEEGARLREWIDKLLTEVEIASGKMKCAGESELTLEGGTNKFLADHLNERRLSELAAWSIWNATPNQPPTKDEFKARLQNLSADVDKPVEAVVDKSIPKDKPGLAPTKDEFVKRLELIRNKSKQWRATIDCVWNETKKLVDKANKAVDLTAPLQAASAKVAAAGTSYETWIKGVVSNIGGKFVLDGNVFHDRECPHRPEVTDRNALSLENIQALAPPCTPATCCEGLIHKRPEWVRLAPAPKLSLLARIKNWW